MEKFDSIRIWVLREKKSKKEMNHINPLRPVPKIWTNNSKIANFFNQISIFQIKKSINLLVFQFRQFQLSIWKIPKFPIRKIKKNSNLENFENFQFRKFKKFPNLKIQKISNLENFENFQFRKFKKFPNLKIQKISNWGTPCNNHQRRSKHSSALSA